MVVGAYPFCDPAAPHNNRETIKRITSLQYAFPPAVRLTNELHDLIAKIFIKSPQQRISLAQIKRHPWFLKNLPPDDTPVREGEESRLLGLPGACLPPVWDTAPATWGALSNPGWPNPACLPTGIFC